MDLSELPDEMVVSICNKLSDVELANLGQTSQKNFRICQEILSEREELEYDQVLAFMRAIDACKCKFKLEMYDMNRSITIEDEVSGSYKVTEALMNAQELLLSKSGIEPRIWFFQFLKRGDLIYFLGYMLRNGYWTGKFEKPRLFKPRGVTR